MITTKTYIVLPFGRTVYFSFLSFHFGNLHLPIFYFSPHTSQLNS